MAISSNPTLSSPLPTFPERYNFNTLGSPALTPLPLRGPHLSPYSARALQDSDLMGLAPRSGGPYVNGQWAGAGPEPRPFTLTPPLSFQDNSLMGPGPAPGAGAGFPRPDLPPGAVIGHTPYGPVPRPFFGIPGATFTPLAGANAMAVGGINTLQYGTWLRDGGWPQYNTPIPPMQYPSISAR